MIRYKVPLSDAERETLARMTSKSTRTTGRKFAFARMLLLCDESPFPGGRSAPPDEKTRNTVYAKNDSEGQAITANASKPSEQVIPSHR